MTRRFTLSDTMVVQDERLSTDMHVIGNEKVKSPERTVAIV